MTTRRPLQIHTLRCAGFPGVFGRLCGSFRNGMFVSFRNHSSVDVDEFFYVEHDVTQISPDLGGGQRCLGRINTQFRSLLL